MVSEILKSQLSIINTSNHAGETALHLAVYAGNMNIVEQLLDHGADIDARNEYGESALFYAARRSMPALVRMLLQRGSDMDLEDRFGEKPAEHSSNAHTMQAFETQKVDQAGMLPLNELLLVFRYLDARDVCRSAMVAGRWHRASESEEIWAKLGVRRWECALQSTLGFAAPASALFRPRTSSKRSQKDSRPSSRPSSRDSESSVGSARK